MNVENVNAIKHANGTIHRAYSQNSLIWGEEIILPKYTVSFKISIPTSVRGSISIHLNGKFLRRAADHFNITVTHGAVIKVFYSLWSSGYKFFSDTPGIEKGITIKKDCDIWVGFNKLDEEIM